MIPLPVAPLLGMSVPGPSVLVAAFVAGLGIVALAHGDLDRLSSGALVGGWFLYALTSPSFQFPLALRPLGVVLAAGGAIGLRLSRPLPKPGCDRPIATPTRWLVVYVVFVLLGCLASPFGPRNLIRGVEGILIIAAAMYGVALGFGPKLLAGVWLASFANVGLTVISGTPEVLPGEVGGPERLSGYMHPNHLAFAAAIVVIGAAWLWGQRPRLRVVWMGAAAISGYALLASRSRTGLGALILALGVAIVASTRPEHRARVAALGLAAALLLVPVALPTASGWFNRDGSSSSISSLTGRTDLWPLAADLIGQRPVIGWGVNAVLSPAGAKMQAVLPGVGQAHNAYLEAGLMGGIPGAVAWGVSLLAAMFASWRLPRSDPNRFLLIAATLLVEIYAITESSPAWFGDMFLIYILILAVYEHDPYRHRAKAADMAMAERAEVAP